MIVGIIGANGFLGRNLCQKYLQTGVNVYGIYNEKFKDIPEGCTLFSLKKLPADYIDILYIAIGNYSLDHPEFINQTNIIQALTSQLNFGRIIFISSVAVYGKHSTTIKVDSCYNNPNLYGQSKLTQEFFIRSFKNFAIIRPTYIYGNGMNKNSLLPIWLENAYNKKHLIIFGDGQRQQDYIYIDDLINLCFKVAEDNHNSTVLAASGKSTSNYELAEMICNLFPSTFIEFQGEDSAPSFEFDISDTIKNYKWSSNVSIDTGLQKMISHEGSNL